MKINKSFTPINRNQNGFTLVEMLLVVAVLGVLSGVLLSTINYTQHKKNADDAIRRENLFKIVESLEAYRVSERALYPRDPNGDGNPTDDAMLSTYFKNGWPNGKPVGATYSYWVSPGRDIAGIVVQTNGGFFYKYRTEWGNIRECANPAVASDASCN